MDNTDKENWYALFVATGQEERVKKILETNLQNETDNHLKFVIPVRELRERKAGKWKMVKRKLFPGYILVKGNIDVETYYILKKESGIAKLLRDEEEPLKIQEDELRVLKILTRDKEGYIGISNAFKENDKIKITDGPLAGLEGLIESVNARKGRAKVRLNFLGEKRLVELGINFVDKI